MHHVCRVRNLVNNRTGTSCQVCVQFCFVRRLLVLLPNFVVVVEHIKFLGNHSFWPSNIADIVRDGRNIMWWCQNSYIFPRDNIFPQCWALRRKYNPWENITLLAVHRNVIFHDRPGQYLYIILKEIFSCYESLVLAVCCFSLIMFPWINLWSWKKLWYGLNNFLFVTHY